MPKQEVYHIHPTGWENDPEEERFKLSTLDYLTVCTYNNYALFFRLEDKDKPKAAAILKEGLERTLSQVRHLCGTIEKDPEWGYSFTKKKDSTVQFIVQWLDDPKDNYPSFDDIHKANYGAPTLGDLNLWSVPPMTYGEKPEAHIDGSPLVSAFKANFIRGGLVFIMHHHHYANDVMGWAAELHQLAMNCNAILNKTPFPDWDLANNDLSRLTKKEPPMDQKVEGPPEPQRHPDQVLGQSLLFHLPKSKAAELKKLASPNDGTWISTYDAFNAFIWRTLTRVRAPVFKPEMSDKIFWCEAIDMRRRFHSPKCPPLIQHNVMFLASSPTCPAQQPTVAELISEWPLSKIAYYIRQMTNSCTQESLDQALEYAATIKNKSGLSVRIDSKPPMSILVTDHRDANVTAADFGFARPETYRHIMDQVTEGVIIVYPPRKAGPESDEGVEIAISYEKRLAQTLIDDPEWNKYFEYRGVDAEVGVKK
ncbi:transferase family-domain-containing protein [Hypomontagnella monticulosa]|nr:transferase family-domain-containing protein [Hypomontagnella monticulosa]